MIALLTRVRIGPRLAAAFSILLLGMVALCAYTLVSLTHLAGELSAIKEDRVPKVERLVGMADNINLMARETRNILIFDNAVRQQEWINHIHKAQQENVEYLRLVKPEIRSEEGVKLVAEAEDRLRVYDTDLAEFLARSQNGDISDATDYMDTNLRQSQMALTQVLDTIKKREIDRIGLMADEAVAISDQSRNIAIVAVALLLALGVWLSWLITRSIVGPLQRALREAKRIAQGDLTTTLRVRGRDEAADMLNALMTMQSGLRSIVAEVREGVSSVATASQQIASGNQDLSGRTEQQASSLQQTAASVEQISGNVKSNVQSADHANELATSASGAAGRGGELVNVAVARIGELEASSQRIAEIVGVIDGIAFQTNLLALNAAVEAARAGEQGRGFAVVAAEVRSLALRSAEAAKEIKTLVTRSVEQIQSSSASARDAGSAMGEIVMQVERVSTLVAAICKASHEQDRGVGEVHLAMGTLDEMTQHNAALVEESTAAAESLKHQAQRLTESVASFRLDAGELLQA